MTIQNWLTALAVAGAIGGILMFFVAGATEWGQPGTTQYDEYERANRLIAVPWLLTLVALVALLIAHVRFGMDLWRVATMVLAIAGTVLVLGGNIAEFWLLSDTSYRDEDRGNAWRAFLLGHLLLIVATAGFALRSLIGSDRSGR